MQGLASRFIGLKIAGPTRDSLGAMLEGTASRGPGDHDRSGVERQQLLNDVAADESASSGYRDPSTSKESPGVRMELKSGIPVLICGICCQGLAPPNPPSSSNGRVLERSPLASNPIFAAPCLHLRAECPPPQDENSVGRFRRHLPI